MIRFLLVLALAYGIFWCYNNVDFSAITNSITNGVKNEKTIKAVNQGRAQMAIDNENAMNNNY